jgi:hypothetical protein
MVEANDLVIGTHGRGFYVLDNIGPLREYSPTVASSGDPMLFTPPAGIRSSNPVALTYWLKQPAKRVDIEVLDGAGAVIRTFTSDSASAIAGSARPAIAAGVNRFGWDLRYEGALTFPGMILWGASTAGPAAVPGNYSVRLTVDGRAQTKQIAVRRHPLFTEISDQALRAQFDLGLKIRDKVSEANTAVIESRRIKKEAADRLTKNNDGNLKQLGTRLTTNLTDVEDDIYQIKNQSGQDPLNFPIKINNRLANLLRIINSGDGEPIANLPVLLNEYSKQLDVQTARMQQVLVRDLAAFNAALRRLGLPPVDPPKCTSGRVCPNIS